MFGVVLSGSTSLMTTIGLSRAPDAAARRRQRVLVQSVDGSDRQVRFFSARKLLGNRPLASAMTHRATELSLGMAAEQLYESLPKESREALADLPALLRRLQADAQICGHATTDCRRH